MRLVEDDDFVAAPGGRVADHFAQLANLVDAAIRRRVDFDHIERIPQTDFSARVALVARFRGGALHAIERFGEDARRRRLPHAARAGKNVGVRHAAGLNGIGERASNVPLPDNVRKCLRPPFSRDDLIAHALGTWFLAALPSLRSRCAPC